MKTRSFKIYRAIVNEIAMARNDRVIAISTQMRNTYTRTCPGCKKVFLKKYSSQIHCCKKCQETEITTQHLNLILKNMQNSWNRLKDLINYEEKTK